VTTTSDDTLSPSVVTVSETVADTLATIGEAGLAGRGASFSRLLLAVLGTIAGAFAPAPAAAALAATAGAGCAAGRGFSSAAISSLAFSNSSARAKKSSREILPEST